MNYAVIMAGGSGKRLWPLSRRHHPKQLISAFNGLSLLEMCVKRIKVIFPPEQIIIVTNADYADVVHRHLPELPTENIVGEPMGKDTANAIGLAATVLAQRSPEGIMAVFSADQIIEPAQPLQEAVRRAIKFIEAHPEALFTFGIKAAFANTAFGYLKRGEAVATPRSEGKKGKDKDIFPVAEFKEKPNKSTARKYIRSGKYCWNSGMFIWKIQTILDQINRFLPANAERLTRIGQAWHSDRQNQVLQEEFRQLEKISIDFAVMEQAAEVYMCELDCHWVDVGSYQTLAEAIGTSDRDDNVTIAQTNCQWVDSVNNIAISTTKEHIIAAIHVEDMIIVHTEDATLICHRDETDHLKKLIAQMQEQGLERFT